MVNSIQEVDEFLGRKANAFESDVSFFSDGFAGLTHHGFPCDCLRHCGGMANFSELLDYIRLKVDTGADLTLLLLDLKVSKLSENAKVAAGRSVISTIARHLWEPSTYRVNVVLSIPRVEDHRVIEGVLDGLAAPWMQHYVQNLGFDISTAKELEKIQEILANYSIYEHIWQGEGITNCVSTLHSNENLKKALTLRDLGGYPQKVYEWTVDLSSFQAAALDLGVDGIITNVPERLDQVLKEKFADKYRLATRNDSPWLRHAGFVRPETSRKPIASVSKNLKEVGEQKLNFFKSLFG
ncbi:phospholipase D SdSicTox-betaIIB1bxiv-like isoform X2 [Varroa jacobsoni]|nr:phospholipase D SdSicTox-betaIIB1bxiv-like isoform X2 [Varroa jacobsoni]